MRKRDVDGFSVASFSLGVDGAAGLTQHYGISPRWLDQIPFGGASGIVALRRAARAVQLGDADFVVCVAGDTNSVHSFRQMLPGFTRFTQDAVFPYGGAGPNGSFALLTDHVHAPSAAPRREDFGKICIAQRRERATLSARPDPQATLTMEALSRRHVRSRRRSRLFDCVMPCAGAEAFLVTRR